MVRVTIDDGLNAPSTCTTSITIDNRPDCTITTPAGGVESDDVTVTLDTVDPQGGPLDVTLEHSTDGGTTWTLSTPAGGSPMPYDVNPALAVVPGLGLTALWASETECCCA
jgi:hypothetical protein